MLYNVADPDLFEPDPDPTKIFPNPKTLENLCSFQKWKLIDWGINCFNTCIGLQIRVQRHVMSKSIFLNKLAVIVWIKSKIFYFHLRQDNTKTLFVLFRGPLTLACTFVPVRYIHCTEGWVVFAFFEFHKKSWVCGSLGMYNMGNNQFFCFVFRI